MTGTATYIAADWGTTHLRLFLCSASGVLDRRSGPGVGELQADPEATLFGLIEPWARRDGRLPIWLAGMIGSRNGWREAPYLPCPADVGSLGESTLRFTAQGHRIAIVPGVSCTNPRGAPDVMRGEETQILGAMALDPALGRGRHVLALPGTHTKWALVEDGRIVTFQTSLAGELYRLLRERSTLASIAPAPSAPLDRAADGGAFELGVQRSRDLADAPLVHLLFEVRARQLMEGLSPDAALSYLSGLIIGQDVLGALPLFAGALVPGSIVPIVGAAELANLYGTALAMHGVGAQSLDAGELILAGLSGILQRQGG